MSSRARAMSISAPAAAADASAARAESPASTARRRSATALSARLHALCNSACGAARPSGGVVATTAGRSLAKRGHHLLERLGRRAGLLADVFERCGGALQLAQRRQHRPLVAAMGRRAQVPLVARQPQAAGGVGVGVERGEDRRHLGGALAAQGLVAGQDLSADPIDAADVGGPGVPARRGQRRRGQLRVGGVGGAVGGQRPERAGADACRPRLGQQRRGPIDELHEPSQQRAALGRLGQRGRGQELLAELGRGRRRQQRLGRRRRRGRAESQLEGVEAGRGAQLADDLVHQREHLLDVGRAVAVVLVGPALHRGAGGLGHRQPALRIGLPGDPGEHGRDLVREQRVVVLGARRGVVHGAGGDRVALGLRPVDAPGGQRHQLQLGAGSAESGSENTTRSSIRTHSPKLVNEVPSVRKTRRRADGASCAAAGPAAAAIASSTAPTSLPDAQHTGSAYVARLGSVKTPARYAAVARRVWKTCG